jgi:predicted anti-sigma-YlaC factor YlaD
MPAEDVPDLLAPILVAMGDERSSDRPATTRSATLRPVAAAADGGLRAGRIVLVCCALAQLVSTLPMLLGASTGPIHLDHELGSWDLALSAGFLVAALRPARAWGMLPIVGALTIALVATGTMDVTSGHTTLADESSHSLEVVGLAALWVVARYRATSAQAPQARWSA